MFGRPITHEQQAHVVFFLLVMAVYGCSVFETLMNPCQSVIWWLTTAERNYSCGRKKLTFCFHIMIVL